MHAINWGIHVKKGLIDEKKKTFSEKQNLLEQKPQKKKKKREGWYPYPEESTSTS